MNDIIVYHGSTQIVEFPEIRIAKYNQDFYFGYILHHYAGAGKEMGNKIYRKRYIHYPEKKIFKNLMTILLLVL